MKLDTPQGLANVFFNTTLNKKAKFGNAVITGTTPQQTESLADNLRGVRARMRGAAIRPGKTYRYGNVTRANKYLQSRLEKQDRLAAKVEPHGAEYHADTNRADIHFQRGHRTRDSCGRERRPLVELDTEILVACISGGGRRSRTG